VGRPDPAARTLSPAGSRRGPAASARKWGCRGRGRDTNLKTRVGKRDSKKDRDIGRIGASSAMLGLWLRLDYARTENSAKHHPMLLTIAGHDATILPAAWEPASS
jgi:hypothetical protein